MVPAGYGIRVRCDPEARGSIRGWTEAEAGKKRCQKVIVSCLVSHKGESTGHNNKTGVEQVVALHWDWNDFKACDAVPLPLSVTPFACTEFHVKQCGPYFVSILFRAGSARACSCRPVPVSSLYPEVRYYFI